MLQLLNDPNGTAEKVFDILKRSTERFSARMTMMMFLSRLISEQQRQQQQHSIVFSHMNSNVTG